MLKKWNFALVAVSSILVTGIAMDIAARAEHQCPKETARIQAMNRKYRAQQLKIRREQQTKRANEQCMVLTRQSSLSHPYLKQVYDEIIRYSKGIEDQPKAAVVSFKFSRQKEVCIHRNGFSECPAPGIEKFDLIPGRKDDARYTLNEMSSLGDGYTTVKKAGIKVSSGNQALDQKAIDVIFSIDDLQKVPQRFNNRCFEVKLPRR